MSSVSMICRHHIQFLCLYHGPIITREFCSCFMQSKAAEDDMHIHAEPTPFPPPVSLLHIARVPLLKLHWITQSKDGHTGVTTPPAEAAEGHTGVTTPPAEAAEGHTGVTTLPAEAAECAAIQHFILGQIWYGGMSSSCFAKRMKGPGFAIALCSTQDNACTTGSFSAFVFVLGGCLSVVRSCHIMS